MVKAKHILLFNPIPVRIDVIGNGLNIERTIYCLGKQPDVVQKDVDKNGINSKKLKTIFDKQQFELLTSSTTISGGVDWEDLNEEDFESMINEEPKIEVKTSEAVYTEDKKVVNASTKESYNYSIDIFKEDHVINLQNKIATITGIEPFKQHVSIGGKSMTHYIESKSSIDIVQDNLNLFSYLENTKTLIKGIPVDEQYLFTKANNEIINTQAVEVNAFLNNVDAMRIMVFSIDSILTDLNALRFLSRTDKQSFEIIYESFIERFFLMMDFDTLNSYLSEEHESELSSIQKTVKTQITLSEKLNKIPQVTTQNKDITITTISLNLQSSFHPEPVLSLLTLFNEFILTKNSNIFYLDLFITTNNRLKQVRKISKFASQAINFVENVSMNIKPLVSFVREYRNSDYLVITLLPSENFSKLLLRINSYGRIEIIAHSNKSSEITKVSFINEISKYVVQIVQYVNSIQLAFISTYKLETDLMLFTMSKSTSRLMFNSRIEYESILKLFIKELCGAGLLTNEVQIVINPKLKSFLLNEGLGEDSKLIQIQSSSNIASFTLIDLDFKETKFYVDLIGRFVNYHLNEIKMKLDETKGFQSVDPVLYKYKSKLNYSRVCQKKFQPVIVEPTEKNAVEYHNFTFNEPQYYKCPTKQNPYLGFLSGYHPNGYCLPCCRKQEQINRDAIIDACISGEPIEESKKSAKPAKYYIIDYPNDLVPNTRFHGRFVNMPDKLNKMFTKGRNLIVNGLSISYEDPLIYAQVLNILKIYLGKSSSRNIIITLIDFIKDGTNHKKILSMPTIAYSFHDINSLLNAINETFVKQTVINHEKNWNDILIDLAICFGIGIVTLADNRAKASECSTANNQTEECAIENVQASSFRLENLQFVNLDKPVLFILKRIDAEYSRIHHERRYHYYPIMTNEIIEPIVTSIVETVVEQFKKIKKINDQPVTRTIDKSFNHVTLTELVSKNFQVTTLVKDVNDIDIAYAEILFKPVRKTLISLYGIPALDTKIPIVSTIKNFKFTANLNDILSLIENHNQLQLKTINLSNYHDYMKVNYTNEKFVLPNDSTRFLLKVDKFIIYDSKVIGVRIATVDKNKINHTLIAYINPEPVVNILTYIKKQVSKYEKLDRHKLTMDDIKNIILSPLDTVERSITVIYKYMKLIGDSTLNRFFVEFIENPINLLKINAQSIQYKTNDTLEKGKYMSNIYRITVNKFITEWKQSKPMDLIDSIIKLVNGSTPNSLKSLSNNLIEDWVDKIVTQYANVYHPIIIRAEIFDLVEYIQLNVRTKTKDNIVKLLKQATLPINDIEIHNIAYSSKKDIETLVLATAKDCVVKVKSFPTFSKTNEQYMDKSGKILIVESIYNQLIDMFISDLANQFRREYILNNSLYIALNNTMKLKSQMNELIYIQEL